MFTIEHDDCIYKVKFSYLENKGHKISKANLYLLTIDENTPENWKAIILDGNCDVSGTSICNPEDVYDKCLGRTIALRRLTDQLSRDVSFKIWQEYRKRCKLSSFKKKVNQ